MRRPSPWVAAALLSSKNSLALTQLRYVRYGQPCLLAHEGVDSHNPMV
jgi:hypothetical protein